MALTYTTNSAAVSIQIDEENSKDQTPLLVIIGGKGNNRCETKCQANGGCQVTIIKGDFSGKSTGSCSAPSSGGSCSDIPDSCVKGSNINEQCPECSFLKTFR